MELILAYGAGLLTLINPCVLPVLPIVLATALQAHRAGPAVLALGMSVSFVTFGMLISTVGYAIGLTEDTVATAGAVLMIGFGLVMLIPQANAVFASATAGFAARADSGIDGFDRSSLWGQFGGGLLLGAVWSPCIGPTLGGAIALASQGESLLRAFAIMVMFAAGVSTLILAIGYGLRATALRRFANVSRPVLGAAFLLVGFAILFRINHMIDAWLLQNMPAWLVDLSVSI
ncbi:cytochrome c biogenesis protein CcdA [Maritimibacter sp. UBA3975]|uniref:cytochrome c biogenesis CcdA family protein n=1 Tax=Maritimibacter sp. UBA3975 TaxID=1946833 RepID=UPI000C094A97|nr:cytochrome c biogenesis protein CcdA [Maritimibacter sp. UBA3975]MAM63300.1 cytochrome C biogenesis protein CcdA [Maritimibacter sp.]|tara:strand:- start:45060 stop:45755 length:696 start_codon:yes stop_codon:yes gene_type:complete